MINEPEFRITPLRLIRTWFLNGLNGTVFLCTWGRRVLHEGRFRHRRWTDWARAFHITPAHHLTPASEDDVRRIVRAARKVRVVGAGHSFNAAPLTDETMLSLDQLDGVELIPDPERAGWAIARVQAGIRLRALNEKLAADGFALSVAGSTDPQSVGGLVATDLHGTGRDHGFLSESLLSLRIVDGQGRVADHRPGDDVFHAAIGGFGTCGVVVGADIAVEPAYNLATSVKVVDRRWAEENIDALLAENSHLSFYYFGGFARDDAQDETEGLTVVRMNRWRRTVDPPSQFLRTRSLVAELADLVFSGFLFDAARMLHIANPVARIGLRLYGFVVNQREIVYPAAQGFARTLYYRHDEIEYGVPFERYQECLLAVRKLLLGRRYPTIVEVRFTPDNSQALLGPGVGRRTAYIELASSMVRPTDPIFEEFEAIVRAHGGQPHLGKKTYIGPDELAEIYGEVKMRRFESARCRQDPDGKFLNDYALSLLGAKPRVAQRA